MTLKEINRNHNANQKTSKSTVKIFGYADHIAEYIPQLTTPADIREALRKAAQETGHPIGEIILLNTRPNMKAQVYYIETAKEPKK